MVNMTDPEHTKPGSLEEQSLAATSPGSLPSTETKRMQAEVANSMHCQNKSEPVSLGPS